MTEVARALGVAIRKGQDAGEILSNGQVGNGRSSRRDELPSPAQYFAHGQEKTDTYNMTDNVSDAQFDEALADARFEENMSRANVVILRPASNENRHHSVSPKTHNLAL